MFFDTGPADTFNYMLLGYAVILVPIALLILSIFTRFRQLKRDLVMLEEMDA